MTSVGLGGLSMVSFLVPRGTTSMFGDFLRLWSLLSVLESLVFVWWVKARCAATVI
jgi:hypothetical protein